MLLKRLINDNKSELKLNSLQKKMKVQVTKKLDDGVYKFEEIKCPVCDGIGKECIGEKDRYGLFFKTNICTECGLVYTDPRMDQPSYNEFYNIEYRKLYVGQETATDNFFNAQKNKGQRIYSYLKENNLIKNRSSFVLEVGCGAGGILTIFENNGHKVKGIDLGKEYVEYGIKNQGLNLEVGVLSDIRLEKDPDIIIYSHVLEHILDLNKELQTITKYITKDTIVYIEVPGIKEIHKNYESNILKYFQNAHTFHFTLESLTNLFSKHGFELICGNQFVQSVFKLTCDTRSIKSDYESVKAYITKTEKRRGLYPFTVRGSKRYAKQFILKALDIAKLRPLARKLKNSLASNK